MLARPPIHPDRLRELLASHFGGSVTHIAAIDQGQIARTFSFDAAGAAYVIRLCFANLDAGYEKEAFVARTFASETVPIPRVVAIGRLNGVPEVSEDGSSRVVDLCYCITEKAAGRTLFDLSPAEAEEALPSVLDTLGSIQAYDVSAWPGHGLFDGDGRGLSRTWPEYLQGVAREEREDGFFGRWHRLFESTFLEREVFEDVYAAMASRLEAGVGERRLVHGGYASRNMLVAGGRISAVIDWLDAKWGDPLFDVAYFDLWQPEAAFRERFRSRCAARGTVFPEFEARILCYQCYTALDGFRFFALKNDPAAYRWTKERIRSRIAEPSDGALEGPPPLH